MNLESAVGIDETDNALQCVKADAHASYAVLNGNIDTTRLEFPAWMQTANLDTATTEDLINIFESIDSIAQTLNCKQ